MLNFKLIICLYLFHYFVNGHLEDKFHAYQIITSSDVQVHSLSRRSVEERQITKEVHVSLFGQNFTITGKPSRIFSPDFQLLVVNGDGTAEEVSDFRKDGFLTGQVVGDLSSQASFHIDDDDVITGVFITKGTEYVLEPLSNHVGKTEKSYAKSAMIGYRREDIKSDNHPLCGAVHPEDEGYTQPDDVENKQFKHDGRTKRAIGNKICKIVAVADYRYYQQQGREVFKTANNIANIMSKVNQVYSQTQFRGGKGYGFEFSKLIIHTAASTTQSDQQMYPYNIPKTNWRTQELLDALSSASVHSGSCLTHLFTATAMSERVLGLAYIAKPGKTGGICSPRVSYNGVLKAFNTGWSTSLNGDGQTLTFLQQALVTAHEFGHNWGSEHDPSSGDCAPGTILDDGKYLMFAYSVTGEDSNNELFSSCSINYVNQVLATQSVCFTEATPYSPCGNGRLETSLGEQCDAGFLGSVDQDVCCTSNCKLRPNAQCSPSNQACCTSSCFLAPSTMTCRGEVEGTCKARQNCSGTSYDCPLSGNKADGTDCLDGGQCLFGECKTFCEYRNFNSCVCDTVETSCKRCCRDVNSGRCKVMDQALNVANGRSCIQGYCTAGVCIKVETDLIARLWNLIDQISFDFLVESFKTNMVACITGFSLILYFPICVVIWCYDRRRKNKWEKEFTAHIRTDRGLAHDENKRPIVRPGQPEAPAKLNASDLLDHSSYRRPNSRNQVQPVGNLPSWSKA